MKDAPTLAQHQAAWPGMPVDPAAVPLRHLAALRSIMAIWEERKRLRRQLEQMLKDNPHLIDDIGLTRRQVEAEVAKPFWRA